MRITILLPHYKTWKITLYAMHKLLEHKGKHQLNVVIIDNSVGHGTDEIIEWCEKKVEAGIKFLYTAYPKDLTQSHGLAFDWALMQGLVETDYFITVESDSFPTQDNWLDTYEQLINEGYDMAGSRLRLSGGEYIHPAGAMYKKSNWEQAKKDVHTLYNLRYKLYPNLLMKDGFPCHTMVDIDYHIPMELEKHHSYNNVSFEDQRTKQLPVAESVFHNPMGFKQESYLTYGQRNIDSEKDSIFPPVYGFPSLIYRMGYEPGQWFAYWHYATNKKVFQIGTEIVWMKDRVNQQQEYTLMDNGFKHLWGVTAYGGGERGEATADIYDRKKQLMEELYNSIK